MGLNKKDFPPPDEATVEAVLIPQIEQYIEYAPKYLITTTDGQTETVVPIFFFTQFLNYIETSARTVLLTQSRQWKTYHREYVQAADQTVTENGYRQFISVADITKVLRYFAQLGRLKTNVQPTLPRHRKIFSHTKSARPAAPQHNAEKPVTSKESALRTLPLGSREEFKHACQVISVPWSQIPQLWHSIEQLQVKWKLPEFPIEMTISGTAYAAFEMNQSPRFTENETELFTKALCVAYLAQRYCQEQGISLEERDTERSPAEQETDFQSQVRRYASAVPQLETIILQANLRLILDRACRLSDPHSSEFYEYVLEGKASFIENLRNFDPTRGAKITTYLLWWLRRDIQRYYHKQRSPISFPTTLYEEMLAAQRHAEAAGFTLETLPNEVLPAHNLTAGRRQLLANLYRETQPATSLNLPIGEEGEYELGDILEADTEPPDDNGYDFGWGEIPSTAVKPVLEALVDAVLLRPARIIHQTRGEKTELIRSETDRRERMGRVLSLRYYLYEPSPLPNKQGKIPLRSFEQVADLMRQQSARYAGRTPTADLSRERIRQIESEAIQLLSEALDTNLADSLPSTQLLR